MMQERQASDTWGHCAAHFAESKPEHPEAFWQIELQFTLPEEEPPPPCDEVPPPPWVDLARQTPVLAGVPLEEPPAPGSVPEPPWPWLVAEPPAPGSVPEPPWPWLELEPPALEEDPPPPWLELPPPPWLEPVQIAAHACGGSPVQSPGWERTHSRHPSGKVP